MSDFTNSQVKFKIMPKSSFKLRAVVEEELGSRAEISSERNSTDKWIIKASMFICWLFSLGEGYDNINFKKC